MLNVSPAVFVVGSDYQILVPVETESLFWVRVGDRNYYDEANGIMRSLSEIHRVTVPMKALDEAGEYTVCIRPLVERKPYFTETAPVWEKTFAFYPVPETNARAFHISDAHNKITEPVNACKTFGKIDFLILNGDVIDHSGDPSKFSNIYEICSLLTKGELPVVFSRGNHDMRGNFAEKFADYTPNQRGNTYYSFRLGSIWGLLVDCGEDKLDCSVEYGHTVACHPFRERQTEYIKHVIANAESEYAAEGVRTKLIISHVPFTFQDPDPMFGIEEDLYREWAALFRDHVKPDLMICGHTHRLELRQPGSKDDTYGQPCPIAISAQLSSGYYAGNGFVFADGKAEIISTDSEGETLSTQTVNYK